MKKRVLLVFTILLLFSLQMNMSYTYSFQNQEEKNLVINEYDYSNWFWTDIEVLTGGDDDSFNIEMVVDEMNNIHFIWQDDTDDLAGSGSDLDLFYMNWNFATETLSSIELVSTEGSSISEGGKLAIDTDGNIHVVWLDSADLLGAGGTDMDVFYRMRSVSGVWSSYELLSDVSDSNAQELTITGDSFDNIYVAWSDPTDVGDLGGTDRDIFYNVYDDGTDTWKGMTLVADDSSSVSVEPCLAVDSKDYIHLVWTDSTDILGAGSDYDIFYMKLLSSFSIWSSTQVVSKESTDDSRDGIMCIDSEDSIHVVWYDETDYLSSGTDLDIFYKYYDSLKSSWTPTEVLSVYADAPSALPIIAVDDSDTLHLVWEDQTDYGGIGSDWDIVYQYKDKNSNQWSQLALVSLDPDSESYVPTILVDKFNHIHIAWYDNTDYLGSDADYDIFYRKFVGPPEVTILTPFASDIIEVGNLTLTWQEVNSAENYQVFRDRAYIYSTSALSPIATVSELRFTDTLDLSGDYYYTVIATNRFGESDSSNIESVTVLEPSGLFQSIKLGEIFMLAGILGGFQLILFTIVIVIFRKKPEKE